MNVHIPGSSARVWGSVTDTVPTIATAVSASEVNSQPVSEISRHYYFCVAHLDLDIYLQKSLQKCQRDYI